MTEAITPGGEGGAGGRSLGTTKLTILLLIDVSGRVWHVRHDSGKESHPETPGLAGSVRKRTVVFEGNEDPMFDLGDSNYTRGVDRGQAEEMLNPVA